MQLTVDMLDDLAVGAAFLATGGGGDPYLALLSARAGLDQYGPARLVKPNDVSDTAHIVAIGAVGAPTTSLELLPSIDESVAVIEAYQAHTGRSIDAVAAFEIGGGNSLIPIVAAAAKDIPLIDGDGMGRALPEATMMTYAIAGIDPTPAVALDYAGNTKLIDAASTAEYEPLIRAFSMQRGGMVLSAEFYMSGAQMKSCIVPDTYALSIDLGKLLRSKSGTAEQLTDRMVEIFEPTQYGEVRFLFSGLITDIASQIVEGYDVGRATLEALNAERTEFTIDIKNEYLTVRQGANMLASVPDLICILDSESGQPINAERLRYGQRVTVFAIGCPQHYRTDAALAVVEPRCFGYDFDYIPLENLPLPEL